MRFDSLTRYGYLTPYGYLHAIWPTVRNPQEETDEAVSRKARPCNQPASLANRQSAWGLALVTAGVLASSFLGDALTTSQDFTDEPDSKRATALLEASGLRAPEEGTEFVLVTSDAPVTEPEARAFVGYFQESRSMDSGPTSSITSGAS